ncbi:hypothetical protein [Tropicibacter sp. S64]|uniref:hypothetical protein n=1 Tax=Tropicibacter sp. S64 TaxID=3415122 RepID=UPI003C7D6D87
MRLQPARFLMGFRDIRRGAKVTLSSEEHSARIIYGAGSRRPKQFGDLALFEATVGVKYLPPALMVLIVFLLIRDEGIASLWVGLHALIFILGGIYMVALTHRTRIVLDGNMLHKRDWLFRHQIYDLADLTHAEEDKSGNYRLQFEDGRSTFILKYVTGHAALKDIMIRALEINGR